MTLNEELDALVGKGLVADIFRAERAFALLRAIGTNATTVNSKEIGNYGELFGTFQNALVSECALSTARLFDKPSPRFPTRCVKYVLDFLRDHADKMPPLEEEHQLTQTLKAAGLDGLVDAMQKGPKEFTLAVVDHFEGILTSKVTADALEALKKLRDKVIAHNEHVEGIAGPSWSALNDLLGHAKLLVGILGWAWLKTAFDVNGEFLTTSDARRPSLAFERLLGTVYPQSAQEGS
jgi:hypothetical protein